MANYSYKKFFLRLKASPQYIRYRQTGTTEIAGVDITGVIGSRKSMCAQKSLSYTLSRPMCCSYFWQMRHKTKALM